MILIFFVCFLDFETLSLYVAQAALDLPLVPNTRSLLPQAPLQFLAAGLMPHVWLCLQFLW